MNYSGPNERARLVEALKVLPGTQADHERYAEHIAKIRDISCELVSPNWTKEKDKNATAALEKLGKAAEGFDSLVKEIADLAQHVASIRQYAAPNPKGGVILNQEAHGIAEAVVTVFQEATGTEVKRNTNRDTGKPIGPIYDLVESCFAVYGVKADADATLRAIQDLEKAG